MPAEPCEYDDSLRHIGPETWRRLAEDHEALAACQKSLAECQQALAACQKSLAECQQALAACQKSLAELKGDLRFMGRCIGWCSALLIVLRWLGWL